MIAPRTSCSFRVVESIGVLFCGFYPCSQFRMLVLEFQKDTALVKRGL